MTPQKQLHADIAEMIRDARKMEIFADQLATDIINLVRSRVEVVTPEMLRGLSPETRELAAKYRYEFRTMFADSALGKGKP